MLAPLASKAKVLRRMPPWSTQDRSAQHMEPV